MRNPKSRIPTTSPALAQNSAMPIIEPSRRTFVKTGYVTGLVLPNPSKSKRSANHFRVAPSKLSYNLNLNMRLARLLPTLLLVLAAGVGVAQTKSAATKKVVLGKLGQAIESTPIKASPKTSAKTFYKVKPYEYLVIQTSQHAGWLRVLLENGRFGYVEADDVARLPYEVEADAPAAPTRNVGAPLSRSGSAANYVADRGLQYQGVRYKWGGTNPADGIDCSAFVKIIYGEIGVSLPRTAAEQALVGMPISRLEDLQKGDRLYFWSSSRGKIGHTGVYLGNGYFVHSSSGKGKVTTDYLGSPKWMKILVAARR